MRPYTSEEAKSIAEACEMYLNAHSRRRPDAHVMTPRENFALNVLRDEITVREREALETATGLAT